MALADPGDPSLPGRPEEMRDRVIQAIYQTVLRPEQFGDFMEIWRDHIQSALSDADNDTPIAAISSSLDSDPGLQDHFRRAYGLLEQVGRGSTRDDILRQVETASNLSLLARENGQIVVASATARQLLGGGETLAVLTDRLNASSAALLRDLFAAARRWQAEAPAVVLIQEIAPRHLIARLVEAPQQGGAGGFLIAIEALDDTWSPRAGDILVASFGLSRAEVDIVRNLLSGRTVREIADQSNRSEHTVRNQTKSVLSKTGAPGQVDLIRLVACLINQEGAASSVDHAPPHELLEMPTGLRMQVFRAGPADGRPVVFINGVLDGSAPVRFLQDRLAERGLQIIAPIRPGFGVSDPAPSPDQMPGLFVDHVRALLSQLGQQKPVLLGNMTGSVFAQLLASQLQDRIAGVVAVAGGVPILRMRQLRRMAPRQRAVFYTARYAPMLLPTVLRAGIAQLDSGDGDAFLTALHRPGTLDHDFIRSQGLEPLILSGIREAVQQGHRGFADEVQFLVRDWSAQTDAATAETLFLSGAHDQVVDPEDIRAVMAGRAGVEVRVLPNEGQRILYSRPDTVLDAVCAFSG